MRPSTPEGLAACNQAYAAVRDFAPHGQIRLKRLRSKQRVSLRDLAAEVGVSYAYISMMESGVSTNPSLDLVKQLAKALKVTVGELVE